MESDVALTQAFTEKMIGFFEIWIMVINGIELQYSYRLINRELGIDHDTDYIALFVTTPIAKL